jgi:hypothetical protein
LEDRKMVKDVTIILKVRVFDEDELTKAADTDYVGTGIHEEVVSAMLSGKAPLDCGYEIVSVGLEYAGPTWMGQS